MTRRRPSRRWAWFGPNRCRRSEDGRHVPTRLAEPAACAMCGRTL